MIHSVSLQGSGPYTLRVKEIEDDIQAKIKTVNEAAGIKESDTGLAVPALWDLAADKQALQTEEPLQVELGRCVPIREVSSFQRLVCTSFNGVGT